MFAPMCGVRAEAGSGSSAWTRPIGSRLEGRERGMDCLTMMPELLCGWMGEALTITALGSMRRALAQNFTRLTNRPDPFIVLLRKPLIVGSPIDTAFMR